MHCASVAGDRQRQAPERAASSAVLRYYFRNAVLEGPEMKKKPSMTRRLFELVGTQGFEPWTDGLRVRCSTN